LISDNNIVEPYFVFTIIGCRFRRRNEKSNVCSKKDKVLGSRWSICWH